MSELLSFGTLAHQEQLFLAIQASHIYIAGTWIAQYFVWKRKIKKMNEGIKDNNDMN